MTDARSMFYVMPDSGDLVKIISPGPEMREDMVRIAKGTSDIRYRAIFNEWSVKLNVKYNADVISQHQLVNLFELAGFTSGIGEWRMGTGGTFGAYTLMNTDETDGGE